MFGSGSSHGIYALFIAAATKANGGRPIGLLRGASTRFGTMFYAMHRVVRLKSALLATIHDNNFTSLDIVRKNDRVRLAVMDLKNEAFWQAMYLVLRNNFPALRALRYCDANVPSMDKLYFLSHRVTKALEMSSEDLNFKSLLSTFKDDEGVGFENQEVFGSSGEDADEGAAVDSE